MQSFADRINELRNLQEWVGPYGEQGHPVRQGNFEIMYRFLDVMKEIAEVPDPQVAPTYDGDLSLIWSGVTCEIFSDEVEKYIVVCTSNTSEMFNIINDSALWNAAYLACHKIGGVLKKLE